MESSSLSDNKAVMEENRQENARVLQWEDFEQELARLLSLSSALNEANQNKILLQEKLQSHIQNWILVANELKENQKLYKQFMYQAEAESLSRLHELEEMHERLESRELVIGNMSMRTKVLKEKVKKQEEQLSTEIRSPLVAGTALSVASKSLQEANKSLAGERGYTQLKDLQKLLRVRQQYMVSQVSLLYPVKVVVGHASEQELESFTCSKSENPSRLKPLDQGSLTISDGRSKIRNSPRIYCTCCFTYCFLLGSSLALPFTFGRFLIIYT